MVGKIILRLLLSSKSLEQKKLAPSLPSAKDISANVWEMVDFPVPARPFNQNTRWSRSSTAQHSICQRTSFLVPFRHPCLFPEWCPAPAAWCIPLRRVRSVVSYLLFTTQPNCKIAGLTMRRQFLSKISCCNDIWYKCQVG